MTRTFGRRVFAVRLWLMSSPCLCACRRRTGVFFVPPFAVDLFKDVDRLSGDQLRDIKGALKILVDPQFAGIPEVQIVSVSLQDLLAKVDVYSTQWSLQADTEVEHEQEEVSVHLPLLGCPEGARCRRRF